MESLDNSTFGSKIADDVCARLDIRCGLPAISYRIGTYSQFKQRMLTNLSTANLPALARLRSRGDDNFTIALLDACAMCLDSLAFYNERYANDAYWRTITEAADLFGLAKLIGYDPSGGKAGATHLAFTLDEALGSSEQYIQKTMIDLGTKVQSTPRSGEQPQLFETLEAVEARAEWNAMRPRLMRQQAVSVDAETLLLEGFTTGVKQGDMLLIVEKPTERVVKRVVGVTVDHEKGVTRVEFSGSGDPLSQDEDVKDLPDMDDPSLETELTPKAVDTLLRYRWPQADLSALVTKQNWDADALFRAINALIPSPSTAPGVFAFRQRIKLFGHHAAKPVEYVTGQPQPQPDWVDWDTAWADWTDAKPSVPPAPLPLVVKLQHLFLDNAYDEVVRGSWVAVQRPDEEAPKSFPVRDATTQPRTDYGLTGQTTKLLLTAFWWEWRREDHPAGGGQDSVVLTEDLFRKIIRGSTVFAQSDHLALAGIPIVDSVRGDRIKLGRAIAGLSEGRTVLVSGEREDLKGAVVSEVKTLREVWLEGRYTVVVLDTPLLHTYVRESVTINANVAVGTHGETIHEILGDGDASRAYQRFTLRQAPLTYIDSETPSGTESTLQIRVDEVLWKEVDTLFGRKGDERVYVTYSDVNGHTTAQFGDGVYGARLPSGNQNIGAVYRKGTGLDGSLEAGQLNQLMTQALGVRGVTNPMPTTGAVPLESREDIRRNAPLRVLTMDRVVSLRDYEDFACGFPGIGKALASGIRVGSARRVFLTVAGPVGTMIPKDSLTLISLASALRRTGFPAVEVEVKTYRRTLFRVDADIRAEVDAIPHTVRSAVETTLRSAFSFAARAFRQAVTLSEIIALIQSVPGVLAVDLNALYRAGDKESLNTRLVAETPYKGDDGEIVAAELLVLDPSSIGRLEILP